MRCGSARPSGMSSCRRSGLANCAPSPERAKSSHVPAAVGVTSELLRIGEVARSSGVREKAVRYYETIGLIQPSRRSAANYRLYDREVLARLGFVRAAQSLGLSLAEIRDILAAQDSGAIPCEHVPTAIDRHRRRLEEQISRLVGLRAELTILRGRLTEAMADGSAQPGQQCPCLHEVVTARR